MSRWRLRSIQIAVALAAAAALLLLFNLGVFAQDNPPPDHRQVGNLSSRALIWVTAEVHLMFAAFVLGVPLFAMVVEIIGART